MTMPNIFHAQSPCFGMFLATERQGEPNMRTVSWFITGRWRDRGSFHLAGGRRSVISQPNKVNVRQRSLPDRCRFGTISETNRRGRSGCSFLRRTICATACQGIEAARERRRSVVEMGRLGAAIILDPHLDIDPHRSGAKIIGVMSEAGRMNLGSPFRASHWCQIELWGQMWGQEITNPVSALFFNGLLMVNGSPTTAVTSTCGQKTLKNLKNIGVPQRRFDPTHLRA